LDVIGWKGFLGRWERLAEYVFRKQPFGIGRFSFVTGTFSSVASFFLTVAFGDVFPLDVRPLVAKEVCIFMYKNVFHLFGICFA
jgi:hypothetical protein